jgi:hypothetical protein
MVLGYDSINDRGVIAVVNAGVVVKNLKLEANGFIILTDAKLRLQKIVNPLVFQHARTGFTTVINTTQPTNNKLYNFPDVSADADVILSQGAQTKTSSLTLASQLICQSSAVIRSNEANGHILTSGTASTSAFNHFLQSKTETLAELDDIPLFNHFAPILSPYRVGTGQFVTFIFPAGFDISRMLASVNIDIGTTGELTLTDDYTLNVLAILTCVGTSGFQILSTSSFANIPLINSRFSLSWSRIASAGTCDLDSVSIYKN